MENKIKFLRKIALKGWIGSFAGIYTHLTSGNIFPCSFSYGRWHFRHMLVLFVWFLSLPPPMDYLIYVWVYCLIQAWGRVFYHVWWDVDSFMLCTFVYAFPYFLYFENSKKIFVFIKANLQCVLFCSFFGHNNIWTCIIECFSS